MKRVVGLDLSLTSSGVAIVTETSRGLLLATEVFKSKGRRNDTLLDRYARLRDLAADILHNAGSAELVVIEGMIAAPTKGGSTQDRSALWWIVVGGLIRRDVPVAVLAPTSLKKAIAGKGNADKVEVALALAKLWPDVELGNNDACDAAGLAHLGAVALGWPVSTLARHREINWTHFPEFSPAQDAA